MHELFVPTAADLLEGALNAASQRVCWKRDAGNPGAAALGTRNVLSDRRIHCRCDGRSRSQSPEKCSLVALGVQGTFSAGQAARSKFAAASQTLPAMLGRCIYEARRLRRRHRWICSSPRSAILSLPSCSVASLEFMPPRAQTTCSPEEPGPHWAHVSAGARPRRPAAASCLTCQCALACFCHRLMAAPLIILLYHGTNSHNAQQATASSLHGCGDWSCCVRPTACLAEARSQTQLRQGACQTGCDVAFALGLLVEFGCEIGSLVVEVGCSPAISSGSWSTTRPLQVRLTRPHPRKKHPKHNYNCNKDHRALPRPHTGRPEHRRLAPAPSRRACPSPAEP